VNRSPEGAEQTDFNYAFGAFRLFPKRQLLLRDGVPLRIGSRALDILTLLVSRSGDVVSKRDFFEICWPGTFVHEANLKVNMTALRRVLSDGEDYQHIATVPGRGYRFVIPVQVRRNEVPTALSPPATRTRKLPKAPQPIGRDGDLARVASALSKTRCLTIVGPGGVGKTTLAVALAHQEYSQYPDGVAFVDLSTVGDPQYAPAAIAAGVGARQSSDETLTEITDLLHGREMLIVLDNCEHLATTVASILDHLLEALPTVRFLATSREPLRMVAEQIYRLSTLPVPATSKIAAVDALDFASVRLFVARAGNRGQYELTDRDAPLVAAICQRLDGIALAIELAASKATALGMSTLLEMLEERFLVLGSGDRSVPMRQQTLLATLDWSYRLLSDDESALLRVLSVFAGKFQLPDVVAMSQAAGFDPHQAIDTLERLANRSMVYAEYHDGALNYRLLETTRAYALAKLEEADERDSALKQHANHILTMFERSAKEQAWRPKAEWMNEYANRVDDLRNALAWAFGTKGDRRLAVRLTAAGIPLWTELSSVAELQSRLERAIIATTDLGDCPPDLVIRLIGARALGAHFAQQMDPITEKAWTDYFRFGVEMERPEYELHGLWGLAAYLIQTGRPLEGITKLEQFLGLAEAQSDWAAISEGHRMLAMAEMYIGRVASARRRLENIAKHHQPPTDPLHFARFHSERGVHVMCSLAVVLYVAGDPDRAMLVAKAAVERAEATGHIVSQSNTLAVSAIPVAVWSGNLDSADQYIEKLEENGRREDIGIWRQECRFFKAAVRARRREPGAASEIRIRLEELVAGGQMLRAPMHYCLVAEALIAEGDFGLAKQHVLEARRLAEEHMAHWCLPEILRLEGLIHVVTGQLPEAEELLRQAVVKAVEIQSATAELRAALTLADILKSASRFGEELEVLQTVCAKFSRDAAFPDILLARARLSRLTENASFV